MARKPEQAKTYKMPKGFAPGVKRMRGEPIMYGEVKQKLNLSLIPTDIDCIKKTAAIEGISASELVGRWARENEEKQKEVEAEREQLCSTIQELESEVARLKEQQLQKTPPDYEAVRDQLFLLAARDRILSNWTISKRTEKKERILKALDLFIAELSEDGS